MPRKGHKEGCQCAVCIKLRAMPEGAELIGQPEPVVGPTFSSIEVGTYFELSGHVFKKVSAGYAMDLTAAGVGSEAVKLLPETKIIPR